MNNLKKIEPYFIKYSDSLQRVFYQRFEKYFTDNIGNPISLIYLCPICLKNTVIIMNGNLYYDKEFSSDHYPPKCVGGANTVLVCKLCNSTFGANIENSLKEFLQRLAFQKKVPKSTLAMKYSLEGVQGKYHGILEWDKYDNLKLDSDFKKYLLVDQTLQKVIQGHSVKQTIYNKSPNYENAFKAILKSAYLYCFSIWGYDFTFSYTGQKIRDILINDCKHPLANFGVFFIDDIEKFQKGLCFLFDPIKCQSFTINLIISDNTSEYRQCFSVIIPGFEKFNWENLNLFQQFVDHENEFHPGLIKLPEENLLKNTPFPSLTRGDKKMTSKFKVGTLD